MKEIKCSEVKSVVGGWGAFNECKPEYGFNPDIHECFDGGPKLKQIPLMPSMPAHGLPGYLQRI